MPPRHTWARAFAITAAIGMLSATTLIAQTANSSFLGSRWDQPGPGNAKKVNNAADYGPGEVTSSIIAAGTGFAAGVVDAAHPLNSVTFAFDSLLPTSPAGTAAALLDQAITIWQNGSGLKIKNLGQVIPDGGGLIGAGAGVPPNDGNTGDIRAAVLPWTTLAPPESHPMMEVIAHAFQPDTATQNVVALGSLGGDIHFRPNKASDPDGGVDWVNDPNAPIGKVDLLTVMIHEVGHALGLGHNTGDPNSVMDPVYNGPRRTLSATDIANITELYSVVNAPEPAAIGLLAAGLLLVRRRPRVTTF